MRSGKKKKRRKGSKSNCQWKHARRRIKQRYDIDLAPDEYRYLINKIQKGDATFLGRSSCRVSKWSIEFKGKTLLAVYDTSRQTIVTFLTPPKNKMKFKVKYSKTVVLESEFEVDVPDVVPEEDRKEWAQEAAYEMEEAGKINWNEVENQGDPPEVTKI